MLSPFKTYSLLIRGPLTLMSTVYFILWLRISANKNFGSAINDSHVQSMSHSRKHG